jgi:hypothetical protein
MNENFQKSVLSGAAGGGACHRDRVRNKQIKFVETATAGKVKEGQGCGPAAGPCRPRAATQSVYG